MRHKNPKQHFCQLLSCIDSHKVSLCASKQSFPPNKYVQSEEPVSLLLSTI